MEESLHPSLIPGSVAIPAIGQTVTCRASNMAKQSDRSGSVPRYGDADYFGLEIDKGLGVNGGLMSSAIIHVNGMDD